MRWLRRDPEVEDYGRRYYLGVIGGAAVLSVAGNVIAFGVEELPFEVALFIHAIPPVIAVLMIHMVATIRTSFMGSIRRDPLTRPTTRAWPPLPGVFQRVKRWFRSWSYGDLILATVLVTLTSVTLVVTLGVSAVSLAKVGEMAGWEGRVSWALPLMLDLPALIATVGFIKAGHRMTEDARAAAVEDEVHEADQAAVEQVAQSGEPVSGEADDAATELSATVVDTDNEAVVDTDIDRRQWVDRRPVVNDRRIVDEPVIDEDRGRRQAVIDDRQWPVDSGFAQVEPVVDTDIDSRQPVDNEAVNSVDQARVDSVVTDNGPVIDSVDSAVIDDRQVVDDIDNGPVDNAPAPVDSVVDDSPTADIDEIVNGRADDGADNDSELAELAAAVVAETNTKVPAEGVAEALRRRREGDSYASIAEAIGIGSHSTVRSLVKAATKLDAAYAAALGEPHRPDLAVVSSQ